MAIALTNRIASQAYRGESVQVFLNQTDSLQLANLTVGQLCTITSSSNVGYISSIDLYGISFMVTPKYPFSAFQSDVIGYLKVSETVTVTT